MALALCAAVLAQAGPAWAAKPKVYDLVRSALQPQEIEARLKRYVPVDLGVDIKRVPTEMRAMLGPIRRAVDEIDRVFWYQISPDAWEIREQLQGSSAQAAQNLAALMSIHYGPWDVHRDDEPFLGTKRRPPGANFYPLDMSKRELEQYIARHPEISAQLWGPYTMVVRKDGELVPVPYSKYFKEDLQAASVALREAAANYQCSGGETCPCAGLARFLEARAKAFRDDEYRSSEMLWMDTGLCPLDVAIGPYEYYEDRLLGLKTAFGAYVYLRDDSESERFKKLLTHYAGLAQNLPLSSALRARYKIVQPSPITIGDVLYTGGDARSGYQVRAFALPNDQVVRRTKGIKSVILRNVVKAKFEYLAQPVAKRILTPKNARFVQFAAYYDILLTWQLAHGVIPGEIALPDGSTTTPRQRLRERYTIVDAIKGEVVALLNYYYLKDHGALPSKDDAEMAYTYLTNLFDSVRLAQGSPQTIARTIIYNYLAQEWVFRYNPKTQTFEANPPAMRQAVRKLADEVLQILARGDYAGAGSLIVQYGIMPSEMRQTLVQLGELPLDIWPRYTSVADLK